MCGAKDTKTLTAVELSDKSVYLKIESTINIQYLHAQ